MTVTKAQAEASKRWKDKNKQRQRGYQYKSSAKRFVRDFASTEELKELRELIDEKIKEDKENVD